MKILRRLLLIFILSLFIFLLGLHNDISKKNEVEYAGAAISNSELEFQDEIELGCICLDNFENIDLNELKISLTIPDSRRWYTNIINGGDVWMLERSGKLCFTKKIFLESFSLISRCSISDMSRANLVKAFLNIFHRTMFIFLMVTIPIFQRYST